MTGALMRSARKRELLAVITAVVPFLAACGLLGGHSDTPKSNGPAEQTSIDLALLPLVGTAPVYIAADKGYFRDEGLDVRLVRASNSPDVVTKVIGGDVQIGEGSYPSEI